MFDFESFAELFKLGPDNKHYGVLKIADCLKLKYFPNRGVFFSKLTILK